LVGVVLVSHLDLGLALRRAAEMLLGEQERIVTVSLQAGTDHEALCREVSAAVAAVAGPAGVLILADLYGGSPEAAAAEVAADAPCPVEVLAGANLPLLIAVLAQRQTLPLGQLASQARKAGREGLVHVPTAGRWPPAAASPD
jgi:mannose/fructose/sorbose-specific phosphotransferase system IIA component